MKQTFEIVGMHCADCANTLTQAIQKVPGVEAVSVNYATDKATLTYDPSKLNFEALKQIVSSVGQYQIVIPEDDSSVAPNTPSGLQAHSDKMPMHSGALKVNELAALKRKVIVGLSLFVLILVGQMTHLLPLPVIFVLSTVVIFYCGKGFFKNAWAGLKHKRANMDTLVAMGVGTAYLYSTIVSFWPALLGENLPVYFDTVAAIVSFILLGRYLEAVAKGRASKALYELLNLQAKNANVLVFNGERVDVEKFPALLGQSELSFMETAVDEVVVGNVLVVKPGEKIPIDGQILEGVSFVDESLVTGESMPAKKQKGDLVIGGTLNQNGRLFIAVSKVGNDSLLAQIIRLVDEAQNSKAPIQNMADRVASVFVPAVIVIAVGTFVVWYFLGGLPLVEAMLLFISVLVVSCPCALGLATPISMVVATGLGAANGIFIRNGEKLQAAAAIDAIVFDKTGTLTRGSFEVTHVLLSDESPIGSESLLMQYAASIEQNANHPIANAILQMAATLPEFAFFPVSSFESVEGQGVAAMIMDQRVLMGTADFLKANGVATALLDNTAQVLAAEGKTIVYMAVDNKLAGLIAISDVLKREALPVVQKLNEQMVVWMLTGDQTATAKAFAGQLGIKNVMAQVSPSQKAQEIKALQSKYQTVAMVGDGVNDAPALAQSDIGIAMSTGTDAAIEVADVTLLRGDVGLVLKAILLAQKTMHNVRQNLFWAFIYNILLIPVAAGLLVPFGIIISPTFASVAMVFSSLTVVFNALRLKRVSLEA